MIASRREGGRLWQKRRLVRWFKFFAKPSVAAVKVTEGEVNVNDTLKFFGHTTDLPR